MHQPESTNSVNNALPISDGLNIAALSRLFASTTNSYKYIFFISILDLLYRRKFDVSEPIAFRELVIEMLANAWYPHTYFKLSFGTQDQIAKTLELLNLEAGLKFTELDKKQLREAIESKEKELIDRVIKDLSRYVPFRLIMSFLEETGEIPDRGKADLADRAIPKIAATYFDTYKPLYKFNSEEYDLCDRLIFHPDWTNYLDRHYAIVRGWVSWKWLEYMQKRNPTTPALSYKLFAPNKRESLKKQTEYWKLILQNTESELKCIYSDRPIDINRFSLDHYLPWSFVAHDRLWNLIPTFPEINSAKSDRLPTSEDFDRFVAIQHLGLTTYYREVKETIWHKTVAEYIEDLAIDPDELRDLDKLKTAYSRVICPLLSLAASQGFKMWERFSR